MTALLHTEQLELDAVLEETLLQAACNIALKTILNERKTLTYNTYTEKTKIYNWWEPEGKRLLGPTAFPIKYLRQSDMDYEAFECDCEDEVYLAYDYIFTNHSVAFPVFDDTDNESNVVDMLTSAMGTLIINDNLDQCKAYLTAYYALQSLYLEASEIKPDFKQAKTIARGVRPWNLGRQL